MTHQSYCGTVDIETGGYWVLSDSDPGEWRAGDYSSNFAGVTATEGIYLISGHFASPISVTVEVHDVRPEEPAGWEKSVELEADHPSRVARAWCEALPPDDELSAIEMPAERVGLRVLANGWTTPPVSGAPPENWLIQVWSADVVPSVPGGRQRAGVVFADPSLAAEVPAAQGFRGRDRSR